MWLDEAAGPVVRPYAMTSGRTRPSSGDFDLIAIVVSSRSITASDVGLTPEHGAIVRLCQRPISVGRRRHSWTCPSGSYGSCSATSSTGNLSSCVAPSRRRNCPPSACSRRSSMDYGLFDPDDEGPSVPTAIKILVAGGFGAGKTTLVGSVSETRPLRTEEYLTDQSIGIDDISGVEATTTTTVAMDFGRITINESLLLYLFGTPGQDRFWFVWGELALGALGAIVLADTRRLADCFPSVDYFERCDMPFI